VRREHEFRHGGRESIVEPTLADDLARHLWDSQPELLALWREPAGNNPKHRISSA
jgi:hypothetical protein